MPTDAEWYDDEDRPPKGRISASSYSNTSSQGPKTPTWDDDLPFASTATPSRRISGPAHDVGLEFGPISKPPMEACVFPCLMVLSAPTVIRIPLDLLQDLRVLPMVLASTAATRGNLGPFGTGAGMHVTVLMGGTKHAAEDVHALGQIRDQESAQRDDSALPMQEVRLLHQIAGGPRLHDELGRRILQDQLPPKSILIIYDLVGWSGDAAMSSDTCNEIMNWLTGLCAQGHTPVVFEPSELLAEGLFNLVDREDIVKIDFDPVAPHENGGGGCILRRVRRGIFDELPLRWNFWYRVQEGQLRWGMEVRDDIDDQSLSQHELKVLLRQIDVVKAIKANPRIMQNELAHDLKVSASTICRDYKELRRAGRIP